MRNGKSRGSIPPCFTIFFTIVRVQIPSGLLKFKIMPVYKFIITIIGGTWNGQVITKFSEQEKNMAVSLIKETYGLECSIQKIKLY
jgi:hypothetical protein